MNNTSLDNAFLQQGQQQEEEKDDFGSSRLSEEIISTSDLWS